MLERPSSPEGHLEEMVLSHVRYLVEHLPELKVCTTELDSLQGEYYQQVLSRRQRYFELTRRILKQLSEQDGGSRVEPNLAAFHLFGMLNWLYRWYAPKRGRSPTTVANQITSQFLHGVLETSRGLQPARGNG